MLASALWPSVSSARIIEDRPGTLARTVSIGDLIDRSAERSLHIVYVHGIRAERAGASAALADAVEIDLRRGGRTVSRATTMVPLDPGPWPSAASIAGAAIWTEQEWRDNPPFVVSTQLTASDGRRVIVDELNWWPLVFPIKCKALLVPDHDLSGNDKGHLRLCALKDARSRHHAWIAPERAEALIRARPRSGGGTLVNRVLKHQIMNWGLSDAVVALGPMRLYLNQAVENAFAHALRSEAGSRQFVVVTESLGSFIVLDASRRGTATRQLLSQTYDLYFFANQVALLDLARLNVGEQVNAVGGLAAGPRDAGAMDALRDWAAQPRTLAAARPRQIVAFSDPSDILTWNVPDMPGSDVIIANLYNRNSRWLFGFAANPAKAHAGHVHNRDVLKVLFRRTSDAPGVGRDRVR